MDDVVAPAGNDNEAWFSRATGVPGHIQAGGQKTVGHEVFVQPREILRGDLFIALEVHVVFEVGELYARRNPIAGGSADEILVRLAFALGDTVKGLDNLRGETLLFQVVKSKFGVLNDVVQNGNDFFVLALAAGHDPQRVQDVRLTSTVNLTLVGGDRNPDGVFQ